MCVRIAEGVPVPRGRPLTGAVTVTVAAMPKFVARSPVCGCDSSLRAAVTLRYRGSPADRYYDSRTRGDHIDGNRRASV